MWIFINVKSEKQKILLEMFVRLMKILRNSHIAWLIQHLCSATGLLIKGYLKIIVLVIMTFIKKVVCKFNHQTHHFDLLTQYSVLLSNAPKL